MGNGHNIVAVGEEESQGVMGYRMVVCQELYYPAICRTIAATNYDGYVRQEFTPKGDPLAALAQAYKVCDV